MKKIILIFFILAMSLSLSNGISYLKQFTFDTQDALKEWKEKIFIGRVLYEVKSEGNKGYVLARSNNASSGLFYALSYSPKKYPYISWSWMVNQFPSKTKSEVLTKKSWIERDDYALRMYIIFPAFIFTNTKCLEYVWVESLAQGAILTSPFYKNIKLVVLQSGNEKVGQWIMEERNIYEDYHRAFGRYPASNVGAIAIMTDSDNTQSSAQARYSDIKVGYERAIAPIPEIKKAGVEKPKPKGWKEYIKELFKREKTY